MACEAISIQWAITLDLTAICLAWPLQRVVEVSGFLLWLVTMLVIFLEQE